MSIVTEDREIRGRAQPFKDLKTNLSIEVVSSQCIITGKNEPLQYALNEQDTQLMTVRDYQLESPV